MVGVHGCNALAGPFEKRERFGAATTGPLIRSFGERGAGAELEARPRRLSCRYVPKFRT